MIFKLNNWILYIDVLSGVLDRGVAQGTVPARALFTSKYKMLLLSAHLSSACSRLSICQIYKSLKL